MNHAQTKNPLSGYKLSKIFEGNNCGYLSHIVAHNICGYLSHLLENCSFLSQFWSRITADI